MSRDVLLFGLTQSAEIAQLQAWAQTTPDLHEMVPDPHRVQLEHWLWSNRARMTGHVMDVGVYNPRRWIGPGYFTLGQYGEDVRGDLLAIPLETASVDVAIVTEVLEHCTNPFAAVAELYRVVKPGGLLFVTSPFWWVEHGIEDYKDFWRFTRDGWALLFQNFASVSITPCALTPEGEQAFDMMRRWECMGFQGLTPPATTGYLVDVVR